MIKESPVCWGQEWSEFSVPCAPTPCPECLVKATRCLISRPLDYFMLIKIMAGLGGWCLHVRAASKASQITGWARSPWAAWSVIKMTTLNRVYCCGRFLGFFFCRFLKEFTILKHSLRIPRKVRKTKKEECKRERTKELAHIRKNKIK